MATQINWTYSHFPSDAIYRPGLLYTEHERANSLCFKPFVVHFVSNFMYLSLSTNSHSFVYSCNGIVWATAVATALLFLGLAGQCICEISR